MPLVAPADPQQAAARVAARDLVQGDVHVDEAVRVDRLEHDRYLVGGAAEVLVEHRHQVCATLLGALLVPEELLHQPRQCAAERVVLRACPVPRVRHAGSLGRDGREGRCLGSRPPADHPFGPRVGRCHAHLLHRRQRQGRQARRALPRRAGPPGHQRRPRPARAPGRRRPPGRPHRRRRDYSALAGLARFDELDLPSKPAYDAVVHFAAVPAILLTSDATTYATNVLSTYNVLEAATRLGIRKVDLRVVGDDLRRLLRPG